MKTATYLSIGKITMTALLSLAFVACSDNNENNTNNNKPPADMKAEVDMKTPADMKMDEDMPEDMKDEPDGGGEKGNARIQIIHASADPGAATVDVYVNDGLLIDDIDFREATNFFPVAAATELKIDITAGDAADNSAPAYTVTIPSLTKDVNYVAVATGLLGADTPEPQKFRLLAIPGAKLTADDATKVAVMGVHGVADAPTVALTVDNGATPAVPSLSFGQYTGNGGDAVYLTVDPATTMFEGTTLVDVRTTEGAQVAGFQTPQLPPGAAVTLVATGALGDGSFGLTAFPASPGATPETSAGIQLAASARAQIIHNAADPAGASVDVYLNGRLYAPLDNFAFRTATPFLSVPSGAEVSIDVTGPDAADNMNPLYNAKVTFNPGEKYLAIANGVVDPTQFDVTANTTIGFSIYAIAGAKESSAETENVEALIFHGATDVPAVGVRAKEGQLELLGSLAYGASTDGYAKIPAAANTAIELFPAADATKTTLVETAAAVDFSTFVGTPLVILASGFAAPAANQNGQAASLLVVPPSGQAVNLELKAP